MALPYPILRCLSRPHYTALRLAAGLLRRGCRDVLGAPQAQWARRGRRRGTLGGCGWGRVSLRPVYALSTVSITWVD
jgi:hypothetical protein